MLIETSAAHVSAVALAPMAVLPQHQRKGIGEQLIRHGIDMLRERGEKIILVVGHPDYYPRFGFSADKASALESPFPPEVFMAIELCPDSLAGIRGRVKYPAAFGT
jgi:putative acetyltransferase